jgi:O-succinylbenzoic acid--CoA ligase
LVSDALSLRAAALESPARDALVFEGRTYSFAALAERAAAVGAALVAEGLGKGTRVALDASNRFETLVTLLALIERGIPFVPLHPRLTAGERAVLVADAGPARVLDDAALATLARSGNKGDGPVVPPGDGELLAMLYTSGTTGTPKGAMLTRGAFVASAIASARNLGWREDDRWLLCMPLCHVGGLSILTRCLMARRCVVLHPRFDPRAVLDGVARRGITLLSVVPTMLRTLLEEDRANELRRARAILVGGAATPFELMEECARRGVQALATYGLTEACSQVTCQQPRFSPRAERGSGRPLPGTEVAVVDEAGEQLPVGAVGRIRVRGPTVMAGYWRAAPLRGAWLDTGDLGALDEAGVLHVHARRTDLIVTGGENVYPVEVEQALERCRGVGRALVFGVDDPRWGQLVAAAIVPTAEMQLSEGALFEEVCSRLAPHKRPRRVCFVSEIPTRPTGKPDRAAAVAAFSGALRPWKS